MKKIFFSAVIILVGITLDVMVSSAQSTQTQNNSTKIEPLFAGKKSGSTITRKEFLTDSTIHYNNENRAASYSYELVSFKITIIQKGKDPILDIYSDGNKIPQQVRDLIKDMPAGSKVFFEYIRAKIEAAPVNGNDIPKATDLGTRPLEPMSFTIVDE